MAETARQRAARKWKRWQPENGGGDPANAGGVWMHGSRQGDKWRCHLFLPGAGYFQFSCDRLAEVETFIEERGWEAE
jgi:hypothetical protein